MTDAPWHRLDVCDSTNDELARLAEAGATSGTVVLSAAQRAGRGRQGRPWASDSAGNLYASILLRPELELARVPPLTLVVGIAVARAVQAAGVNARLKWPNDIVVGARKLGGILAEASSQRGRLEHVVVGIGLNISSAPKEYVATCMADEGGQTVSPENLLRRVISELETPLAEYTSSGLAAVRADYLAIWRDRFRPARAVIAGHVIEGTAIDIADSGALVIEGSSGDRIEVVAGEVDIDYA